MDSIFSIIHSGANAIIPFVILLGVLIFVHELGHFLVARWNGVRVEVFSLGFGKKILQYKKGDTIYAISIVPLGGYVKMFGEQPGDDIAESDKKVSFTHKNVWQRISIVLAGPLMNFFFAILLFISIALIGEEQKAPFVGDIVNGTPAYTFGFRSGDKLISIGDKKIRSYDEFQKELNKYKNSNVKIVVQHEGSTDEAILTAQVGSVANKNPVSLDSQIGDIEGLSYLSQGTTIGLQESSALASLGLKTGDRITSVNGKEVKLWRQLENELVSAKTNEALQLQVERDAGPKEKPDVISLTLSPNAVVKDFSTAALNLDSSDLYVADVVEKSPAEQAGIKKHDRLVEINGKTLTKWEDVINTIKASQPDKPVNVKVMRSSALISLDIKPQMTEQMNMHGKEEKRFTIGVISFANVADIDLVKIKADNVFEAFSRGVVKTWDVSVMTVLSFVRLIQNQISPKNIGGVLSIGQAASESFKMGLSSFLQMMALISVNLFILNLLPIPVLDGGHMVFYTIELIKGSPLSLKKMEIAQQVGMILLMSLMVFALFNDFTRFFRS